MPTVEMLIKELQLYPMDAQLISATVKIKNSKGGSSTLMMRCPPKEK